MIGYLEGTIQFIQPGILVINTAGVGYELAISLNLYENLALVKDKKQIASAWVHTLHKEDTLSLFGFNTKEERDFFRMLLKLPGIGPSIAMTLVSSISRYDFLETIKAKETSLLTRIPGIGKSKAERLLFEFDKKYPKYKLEPAAAGSIKKDSEKMDQKGDAILGLESLGYNSLDARNWVEEFVKECSSKSESIPEAGEIIRSILSSMVKTKSR